MTTTNKSLNQPAINSSGWGPPLNDNADYIDAAFGGDVTINVTGATATPIPLTVSQYRNLIIKFSGLLTANVTYQIPSGVGGQWVVQHVATGAYTITVASLGGGTSTELPLGYSLIVSDGDNIGVPASAGGGGGATGGGTDEIFFENGQTVNFDYTIPDGKNAMSAGPITISSGVTVTVGAGEVWTVV
jgi:hypothetical protein